MDSVGPQVGAVPPGTPVPPRSRGRKVAAIGCLGTVLLIPVLIVGAIATAFAFLDIDAVGGFSATYRPSTVAAIPETISHDQGDIVLDLTELDGETFDQPSRIEFYVDLGEIQVLVPEAMAVTVDAEAGLGQVTVFDQEQEGINPNISSSVDQPDVILDISVGAGQVTVERADPAPSE